MRKSHFSEKIKRLFYKFSRFTKQQKVFILYLLGLVFFLLVLPIIKIAPINAGNTGSHSVWLLNIHMFKVLLIVLICLGILLLWNLSFKFKNFVIAYFGFKENDALVNFGFLFLISTSFLSIGDTINIVSTTTQSVKVSGSYYFIQIYLLLGLVLTLLSVIKHAKEHGDKTRIVNVVDEDALREVQNKQSLKGLFEEESIEPHHTSHHETQHEHHEAQHDHHESHHEHHYRDEEADDS